MQVTLLPGALFGVMVLPSALVLLTKLASQ